MNRIKIGGMLFCCTFFLIVACGGDDELSPGEVEAIQDDLACHKACDEGPELRASQDELTCDEACDLTCEEKCDQESADCLDGCKDSGGRDQQAQCIRFCIDRLTLCKLLCQQPPPR